jgi:hypothetical protein
LFTTNPPFDPIILNDRVIVNGVISVTSTCNEFESNLEIGNISNNKGLKIPVNGPGTEMTQTFNGKTYLEGSNLSNEDYELIAAFDDLHIMRKFTIVQNNNFNVCTKSEVDAKINGISGGGESIPTDPIFK